MKFVFRKHQNRLICVLIMVAAMAGKLGFMLMNLGFLMKNKLDMALDPKIKFEKLFSMFFGLS